MSYRWVSAACVLVVFAGVWSPSYADYARDDEQKPKAQGLDMVSDTVAAAFTKANALLSGNLDITVTPKQRKADEYTIDAMGLRVPKSTAIRTGGALHNDDPL